MTSLRITKRLEFDAGHRLVHHETKCRNPHGHRYAVEVTAELLTDLDTCGRIIDFGEIKTRFGSWLDEQLDHGFICNRADPLLPALRAVGKVHEVGFEPTAENLATYLLGVAGQILNTDRFRIVSVCVHETPSSRAVASI